MCRGELEGEPSTASTVRGTEGSNPSLSSDESGANLTLGGASDPGKLPKGTAVAAAVETCVAAVAS
jgi:hypothetical protein